MIFDDIVDTVGRTPVVRLNRLVPRQDARIFLKLESFNPTGSIKDRPAVFIVSEAQKAGLLRPGGTIVESTSGNFGKSLAMIGAARGYRVILVVDPKTPRSTISFCRALDAEIVVVDRPDASGSYQGARIERVQELLRSVPGAFWPNQYTNPDNPRAHAEATAGEVLAEFDHLDVLVTAVSTGGHISGLARALKRAFPALTVVAVDAYGSSIFGTAFYPYLMRGIGLSWRPTNLDVDVLDLVHLVTDAEAFATSRALARDEGLLLGESGAAVVFASMCAAHRGLGGSILAIAPDGGESYLEEAFDDDWLVDKGIHDLPATTPEVLDASRVPRFAPVSARGLVGESIGASHA